MRLENFDLEKFDLQFEEIAIDRMVEAADFVRDSTKKYYDRVWGQYGPRPVYKTGPYSGKRWTAREHGQMRDSIRTVRLRTKSGRLSRKKNVRVYAGNYLAYYAKILEYYRPYMRLASINSYSRVKQILGAK